MGGERNGALIVRVTAAPVEGKANRALLAVLARALDLPASSIELVHGAAGRDKVVRIATLTADEVRERLARAAG